MIQTGGLPSAPVLSLWTAVSKYNYLQAMEVCGLQDVFQWFGHCSKKVNHVEAPAVEAEASPGSDHPRLL